MDQQCLKLFRRVFSTEFVCELLEAPAPLRRNYYRCDKYFHLDTFESMFEEKCKMGLVWITGEELICYLIKGTSCKCVSKKQINRQGNTRKGGQSAPRFQRQRDNQVKSWSKMITSIMIECYWDYDTGTSLIDGLLIAGNGPVKNDIEVPKELTKLLIDSLSLPFISDKICHEIYNKYSKSIVSGYTLDKIDELLNAILLTNMVVYGIEEINNQIEGCMLQQLIYTPETKEHLDIERCLSYECELIETSNSRIKEYGGALGKTWY
jgi:peptide subunit release factor 1 (eRF1)